MRAVALLLLLLASCAGEPRGTSRPLRHYRGILHCHSLYSHDSKGTYEEILAAARKAGIDFLCMTDHPPKGDAGKSLREGWSGLRDGVLFIQGAEYGDQILAFGIREPVHGPGRRDRIRAIHAQGGLAFACHPEEILDWDEFEEADGMEIYNVHAALKKRQKEPGFWALALKTFKEQPERSFELLHRVDPEILARWDAINRTRPFTGIAGNDSHQNVDLPFGGGKLDPYPRAFAFVTTHVWAEELTQEAILRALKAGRAHVDFHACRGDFRVEVDVDGLLTAPLPAAGTVTLHRDGEELDTAEVDRTYRRPLPGPGAYRVVVRQAGGEPLLLSNPVRFR